MGDEPESPVPHVTPRRKLAWPLARLVLAWLVTMIVLPYAWGRTLVLWMMTGRPELLYLALLVGGCIAGVVLTHGLSRALSGFIRDRVVLRFVVVPWIAVNALLVALQAEPLIPLGLLILLYVPATLWVVWLAWIFYRPSSRRTRFGVLGLLLAVMGGTLAVLKVEGLSGAAHVNFTWRWKASSRVFTETTSPTATANLAQTTPNDYSQFLGPFRSGLLPEVKLTPDWRQNPPRLVWRKTVGEGWGSFAVVGEFAVTQEQRGPDECVVCYRLSDGARVWLHTDPVRFDPELAGPGPRATPTIADGSVYTVGGTGLLNCLNGMDGMRLWTVDILKDNEAENIAHGVCGSPLVVDDKVIVSPTGANGHSLAAYHRDTHQRLWQAGQFQASYCSPMLVEIAGFRQVLLYNSDGVTAHDLQSGQVLWHFPWANDERVHVSQPIANAGKDGQVFISSGYGKGSALFRVERSDDGSWSTKRLWSNKKMKTKFTTPVVYKDHVYGLDEGILACVELATGTERWKAGRYGHGQILLVGSLLLVQAENGQVVLVEPDPAELKERGRLLALDGKTWNNPVLAGRFLLVRNDHEAACFELP
jgi:outer membrane protein assembly factor BamB